MYTDGGARGNPGPAAIGVLARGTENRHQAVTQELVDNSMVPVDGVDHPTKQGVQIRHHFGRSFLRRKSAEISDIQEHDANRPHFAAQVHCLLEQLVRNLR